MANELQKFDIGKAVEEYSAKKGYAEGVKYYHKLIRGNAAVRNSKYYSIVMEFEKTLKDFLYEDSTSSLLELNNIFRKFYQESGKLPDVFIAEGLTIAFDNTSEYLMNLSKIYNLDLYK
ncbi:MAG: hypothetical protein K5865_02820 [Eubacterium sp.]|nr:hypothetical protein [Eubacterium sp.]